MKEELKVNEEINGDLDVLFQALEEKSEFALAAINPDVATVSDNGGC